MILTAFQYLLGDVSDNETFTTIPDDNWVKHVIITPKGEN